MQPLSKQKDKKQTAILSLSSWHTFKHTPVESGVKYSQVVLKQQQPTFKGNFSGPHLLIDVNDI
jgi:hypothetical protein